nr:RNA-directed DNA polymerase, eukaryota, reverse transcriptase zinc-binding domain protein [Tanacetum cinerariifolium]
MFIGEWSDSNLKNVVKILNCFYYASGLKINIDKSQLLGVGVPWSTVAQAAGEIGCMVLNHQFRYLGVMVGELMSRSADTSERKITWIAWQKALASNIHGGLGISSFYALNRALLLKWVWRFISHDGSLWSKVIQAIYGASFELHSSKQMSLWCFIIREVHSLKVKGFDFISHCKKRVGDGLSTRFWLDIRVFEFPLSKRFLRLFTLDVAKEVLVAAKLGSVSIDVSFRRGVRGGVERLGGGASACLLSVLHCSMCHLEDLSLVGFGWAELDVVFGLANVVSFHSASV